MRKSQYKSWAEGRRRAAARKNQRWVIWAQRTVEFSFIALLGLTASIRLLQSWEFAIHLTFAPITFLAGSFYLFLSQPRSSLLRSKSILVLAALSLAGSIVLWFL